MKALNVVLVWHMHQPDYRDPVQGEALLPWAFLHAVKDYGDMLQTALDCGARVTFNLVPTLVEQLEAYASGAIRDRWLDMAGRNPEDLGDGDRAFLVDAFFSVHAERHIQPHARYRELEDLREQGGKPAWSRFTPQDLRDLQVWFLLAWSGHYLRRAPGVVTELLAKGRHFDEEDKQRLLQCYRQTVKGIVGRYREAEARSSIEMSVTPYAHPILPLLCDTGEAARARNGVVLPDTPFRFPEDARRQVRLGLRCADHYFGCGSRGIWPAEGGLSEAAVRILAEEGGCWAASDEALLDKSLPGGLQDRRRLYRLYSFAGLPLLFRDRELSDRIGFVYANWPSREAANDLLDRLRSLAERVPGGLVTLVLDGENCWERYEDNGYPFLEAFYRGITEDPALRLVTASDAVSEHKPEPLDRLAPGSWISGDFDIWIGHPEENRAWEWLGAARRTLQKTDDKARAAALPHLLRAEGSDWFWWFGDHHQTAQAATFDRLFRHHLQAFYEAALRPVPDYLRYPLRATRRRSRVWEPTSMIRPIIDGRVTDYFEWLGAGRVDLAAGGAMHNTSFDLSGFYYGYDERFFYLRFDFQSPIKKLAGPNGVLLLKMQAGADWEIRLASGSDRTEVKRSDAGSVESYSPGAVGTIAEMALPLEILELKAGDRLVLTWRLLAPEGELARWPADGPLMLNYFGSDLKDRQWPL